MKTIHFYLILIAISTASCSNDDQDDPTIRPIHIINHTMLTDGIEHVSIKYEENKISKEVHNDHYTINYKYNRDKLVRIDYLEENNPELNSYFLLEYNTKDQIIKAEHFVLNNQVSVLDYKYEYDYLDGKVIKFTYTEISSGYSYFRLMKYNNEGNIYEINDYTADGTKRLFSGYFVYDRMNNPWKNTIYPNIPSMSPRLHNMVSFEFYSLIYQIDEQDHEQLADSQMLIGDNYTIKYNTDGYPVSINSEKGDTTIFEY